MDEINSRHIMEQLITTIDIVGFVLAIVSAVLAIVSIVFSAIFFWWGKKQNDSAAYLTAKIDEKVACLEKLFDKMYDSTYQIVRENNQAMQRHLFPGSFENQTLENRDMDVFLLIGSRKKITKSEICTELKISREATESIVKRMMERGRVSVDTDGETIIAVESTVSRFHSIDGFAVVKEGEVGQAS